MVQGVPTLWDPSIASTRFPGFIDAAAWSPCSRFIAVAWRSSNEITILDAVTLERLRTTSPTSQLGYSTDLMFSPDGCLLVGNFRTATSASCIVSWDLQTGGPISNISIGRDFGSYCSMSYSSCKTMLGVLFKGARVSTIITYNILSSTPISSHPVKGLAAKTIWTHGECLQFATVESGSITIWEVGFTSNSTPKEVGSLSTPDNFSSNEFLLFPTLSRLSFILKGRVLVWDTQHSKTLLDCVDIKNPRNMSFSSDGHFFICGTKGPEFYLWKESPNGYLLHRKFISSTGSTKQVLSPDGGSMITFSSSTVQLWRTTNSPTSLSSTPTQTSQSTPQDFILDFSPDKELAAVTRRLGNMVTVLHLKSGDPQLVIDTSMEVCAIRMAKSTIVVTDGRKIVTWDLPIGDYVLNTRANIKSSVRTTTFESPVLGPHISISPNLNYIATKKLLECPHIYDTHTGKLLVVAKDGGSVLESTVGFTQGGCEVWCDADEGVDQWEITQDSNSGTIKLVHLEPAEEPLGGFPWQSSCGYQVTDNGWILNSGGKRLLWLPHHWRSDKKDRIWSGKFLGLLCGELPEAVVLDLDLDI